MFNKLQTVWINVMFIDAKESAVVISHISSQGAISEKYGVRE
jgi:hypothetical protein